MNKDLGIKVLFVVVLLFSIYLLISGFFVPGDNNDDDKSIVENDLQLSTYILNMKIGEEYTVTGNVLPDNASDKTINWYSSNPNIVTVNNGIVKAIGPGKTIIKVSTNKANITKMINVTVNVNEVPIERIIIEKPIIELNVGGKENINYSLEPSNANNTNISFLTSNKDVVAFDQSGNIVGIKEGEATITLKSINGVTSEVKVVVTNTGTDVTSVYVDMKKITVYVGDTKTLNATVVPTSATNKSLTWTSSNNKVATVNNGVVKGIKEGTATVRVSSYNDKYKEVTVVVKEKETIYPAISTNSKYYKGSVVATYNSDTLKYRIQSYGGNDYAVIWVKDANKQWNSALPQLGKAFTAESLLTSEINKYGYQKKGLVATNGGFFWDGWGDSPCSIFVINKGRILRDIENKRYSRKQYGVFGITKEGQIKTYDFSTTDYSNNVRVKQELIKDGVRSTFTMVGTLIERNGNYNRSTGSGINRTVLCEVNKNNFVIYSGGSLSFGGIASELRSTYGCKMAVNLDGGGSRKLYYKVGNGAITKRFGGSRAVPDMMYFVEQ